MWQRSPLILQVEITSLLSICRAHELPSWPNPLLLIPSRDNPSAWRQLYSGGSKTLCLRVLEREFLGVLPTVTMLDEIFSSLMLVLMTNCQDLFQTSHCLQLANAGGHVLLSYFLLSSFQISEGGKILLQPVCRHVPASSGPPRYQSESFIQQKQMY